MGQVWDGAETDPEYRSAMDLLNPAAMVTTPQSPLVAGSPCAAQAARGRGAIVSSTEHTVAERAVMKKTRDRKAKIEQRDAEKQNSSPAAGCCQVC